MSDDKTLGKGCWLGCLTVVLVLIGAFLVYFVLVDCPITPNSVLCCRVTPVSQAIERLDSDNAEMREAAATVLACKKDLRAVEPLIRALRKNSYASPDSEATNKEIPIPWDSIEMIRALGALGDPKAVGVLTELLSGENGVREDYSDSDWVEYNVTQALIALGSPPVDAILEKVEHGSLEEKIVALENLGKTKSTHVLPILLETFKNEWRPSVRWGALRGLIAAGKPAVEPILECTEEVDTRLAIQLFLALNHIASSGSGFNEWVYEARMARLFSGDPIAQAHAIYELGEWAQNHKGNHRFLVPFLVDHLDDRRSLIWAPVGVRPSDPSYHETPTTPSREAALALGKVTGMAFGADAERWKEWWREEQFRYLAALKEEFGQHRTPLPR